MNHLVEIKYSKSEKYPKIMINGEEISRYMSLSDYIYDDIFYWADEFFEIMDSELAEAYSVSLTGHPYHDLVLREAMNRSEYCEALCFKALSYRISVEEKYKYALHLNRLHSVLPEEPKPSLLFYCANFDRWEGLGLAGAAVTTDASDYSVSFEGDDLTALLGKYHIVIGESNRIVKRQNGIFLYVTKEYLSVLMDYFNTYHLRLSVIADVFAKLNERSLDRATLLEIEAYNQEEYRLFVEDIPEDLESGMLFELNYWYFPACFEAPEIRVVVSDPAVIEFENGMLTAKEPGVATVSMVDSAGTVYASQQIEVFRHNYVTNIALSFPTTTIKIGDTLTFNTIVTPVDAEDLGEIEYRVSDDSIAVLTGPNQLYALASGRVGITASTPRLERTFYVTVLSQPTGLRVSVEHINLAHPAEAIVYCAVVPEDVPSETKVVWAVSNKEIARIKGCNSKKCCVESVGAGSALLMCKIEGTNISKRIPVNVTKSKGCYVATAVYGSYDCPEVWVLRRFRDGFLSRYWLGRCFIDTYYAVSPKAVALLGEYKWFNRFFRRHLDRLVRYLLKKGYDETPYEDEN
ncbi:MAG: Ig-like domain-containing protein [Clostridia bacterium]|nr:Ig-like domain-containing protein [Clostridia bacterium]